MLAAIKNLYMMLKPTKTNSADLDYITGIDDKLVDMAHSIEVQLHELHT